MARMLDMRTISVLLLLFLACGTDALFGSKPPSCSRLVKDYERDLGKHIVPTNSSDAFLFFLHVPRTAGKTYAQCFLRVSTPPTKRCSPSYDFLRYNTSQVGCRYLVSHDDYSLTQQLPENTAIITQLREPVSRVISSYEFAVEVAARRIQISDEEFFKQKANRTIVNTLNVWPWSHLVPYFRWDMKDHLAKLKADIEASDYKPTWEEHWDDKENRTYFWNNATRESLWEKPKANATLPGYNNPLVTSLADWIESPEAHDLVHNGATLQILGITNYSHWEHAGALRKCFFNDAETRNGLVALAKERLRAMDHVGLTEQLDDSVAALAASLGHKMNDTAYKSVPKTAFSYDGPDFDREQLVTYNKTVDSPPEGTPTQLTVTAARKLIMKLAHEKKKLEDKLAKLEPKLEDLVSQEDEWLEAEEARLARTVLGRLKAAWAWTHEQFLDIVNGLTKGDNGDEEDDDELTEEEIAAAEKYENEEDEDDPYDDIQSPWAAEIMELDKEVFALQQRSDAVNHDYDALMAISQVKGSDVPEGPAVLLLADEQFVETAPLGRNFRKCSETASKAAKRRRRAMQNLRTPREETFEFTSEGRKAIDPAIIARIQELNKADMEIYALGKELLAAALQQQKEAGVLESLPVPPPTPPPKKPKGKDSVETKAVKRVTREGSPDEDVSEGSGEDEHSEL